MTDPNVNLLESLDPQCPRGCGRSMDECFEVEDGAECAGGELWRENQRLKAKLAAPKARECTALCRDVEQDRDEWQRRAEKAEADAARAKPVLEAAEAFRAATLSGERYDLAVHIGAIVLAVDGWKNPAPEEPGGCVCSYTNHDYSGATVRELNADADCPIHGEKVCSRCAGRDGMHTIRGCDGAATLEANRLPHAPCHIQPLHIAHPWGTPAHWCDGASTEAGQ